LFADESAAKRVGRTLGDALVYGTEKIGRYEALLLLSHVTGKDKTEILFNEASPLPEAKHRAFFNGLTRRQGGEPLQYILGQWDFYGLTFNVDKRALIPRQETELLVEETLKFAKKITRADTNSPLRLLDVCTGSGCIAVTLAVLLGADAAVTATDISQDALELAKKNATLHGVAERIHFIQSDLMQEQLRTSGELFDIIVSNPPYIPSGDIAALQTEVRDFEPRLALDGGDDGLELYRRLLPQAYQLLRPNGGLFMEIGQEGAGELTKKAGFANIQIINDYAGLRRVVCAVKP
jgi:release factor glutamine methyltransferase